MNGDEYPQYLHNIEGYTLPPSGGQQQQQQQYPQYLHNIEGYTLPPYNTEDEDFSKTKVDWEAIKKKHLENKQMEENKDGTTDGI